MNLPTGLTAFTGAVLLGWIAIPTIVSVAEDALNSVPRSYREASLALGATHWQTIWGVTLPAARTGVLTAVMLGMGRAIGETMTVMMVTGNAPVMPQQPERLLHPGAHHDRHHRLGDGRGGQRQHSLPRAVLDRIILFLFSLMVNVGRVLDQRAAQESSNDRLLS